MKHLLLGTISLLTILFSNSENSLAQQPCNYWYVSSTGAGTLGTPDNPVGLQYALDNVDPSRNHVRILNGSYTFNDKIVLVSDIILEGGYQVSGTDWILSSGGGTSFNINPTLETSNVSGTDVGYYVGIEASGITGFDLRNITINVQLGGAIGTTADRGRSVYGLYLSGCSNYELSRVEVNTGNASGGLNGSDGSGGVNGSPGSAGQQGECDGCFGFWCSSGGPPGGAGGSGGGGTPAGGTGSGFNGGGGGAGGNGGAEGDNSGGSGGTGGGVSTSPGTTNGGGGPGGGGDPGGSGANGSAGANGTDGANGTSTPDGIIVTGYFLPGAQADSGGDGVAGKGGRGGGGGGGQGCTLCIDGTGNSGGGGGGGAAAGSGGNGGNGGGSSYGIFAWANGAGGQLVDSELNPGAAGSGGTGGNGGTGASGGSGAAGGNNCTGEVGGGGNGGAGGNSGAGGSGATGDTGDSAPIFEDGTAVTQTGSGIPNGFSPIVVSQSQGCTNSEIVLDKNGGDFDLAAMGNPSLVLNVDPLTTTYSTTDNNIAVVYNAMGEYDVVVNGTNYHNFITINSNRPLPTFEVLQDSMPVSALCGSSSVELAANDAGVNYDWAIVHNGVAVPPTGGSGDSTTTHDFGTINGTYYVRLRVKEECCGWSIPVYTELTLAPPIEVYVGPDTVVCPDGFLTFDAGSGFVDYLWTNTDTTQLTQINTTGIYGVTVTDANGCTGYDEVAVGVSPPLDPLVSASGPTTICYGDTIVLTTTGTFTSYLWSDGFTVSDQLVVTNSGDFMVNVTDDLGCTGTSAVVQVNVNPLPNAVVNPGNTQHICEDDSITLSAVAGYDYLWSNGLGTDQSITVNTAGEYFVTVTNENGCVNTSDVVTVEVHSADVPTITPDGPLTFCKGGEVTLDAGPGYSSYLWTSGSTTQSISVTQSGTYSVTVLDIYGCIDSTLLPTPVEVIVWNPQPIVSSFADTIWVVNDNEFDGYQWFLNGVLISGATGSSLIIEETGMYTVEVTDANGCTATSDLFDLLCCVGINDLGTTGTLSVLPNPSNGEYTLTLETNDPVDVTISIMDPLGRVVIEPATFKQNTMLTRLLDITDLPNGIYFLNMEISGERITRKLMKQ